MKTLIGVLPICLAAAGCGPTSNLPAIDTLFLKANDVAGWSEDATKGKPGVESARNKDGVYALIDGDAEPFIAKGFVVFAREYYAKGTASADVRVWQMKDKTVATDTYTSLIVDVSVYKANTWTDVAMGEAGRIADTGALWWANARKNAYVIEVKASPNDTATRADVEAMVKGVAAKIP